MPKPTRELTLEAYQRAVASVWGKVELHTAPLAAENLEPGDVAVYNAQTDEPSDYLFYVQVSRGRTIVFPATRLITS